MLRKHLHSTEKAKQVMEKLYEIFYILDVTSRDCREALLSDMKDYEDAVVSCCAARNQIDYIVTRNIKDFECSKVRVILPDEFMEMTAQD